jgi:hypothetical protein
MNAKIKYDTQILDIKIPEAYYNFTNSLSEMLNVDPKELFKYYSIFYKNNGLYYINSKEDYELLKTILNNKEDIIIQIELIFSSFINNNVPKKMETNFDVQCNLCKKNIVNILFKCIECNIYFCGKCQENHPHSLLQIKTIKEYKKWENKYFQKNLNFEISSMYDKYTVQSIHFSFKPIKNTFRKNTKINNNNSENDSNNIINNNNSENDSNNIINNNNSGNYRNNITNNNNSGNYRNNIANNNNSGNYRNNITNNNNSENQVQLTDSLKALLNEAKKRYNLEGINDNKIIKAIIKSEGYLNEAILYLTEDL